MRKTHPKKFTPVKTPQEPRNSGIFSNSGAGQKKAPTNPHPILKYAMTRKNAPIGAK